jgi:3',5'-cyclic-AMP phosphodiesterase
MKTTALFTLLLIFIWSCEDPFQYNPNEVLLNDDEKNLNEKNISRIESIPHRDTLRFIIISDTHHEYPELDEFVQLVNTMSGIDFVAISGDLTNFGLLAEYRETNNRLKLLRIPYVAVIGNHDLLGNGSKVFEQMYGPLNFHFRCNNHKFIGINTNSREYNFNGKVPDVPWLKNELQDTGSFDKAFVIGHVPPTNPDFDPDLVVGYATTLAESGKVKLAAHGHAGGYSVVDWYSNGVPYLSVDDLSTRSYVLIKVWNDSISVENKTF